MCIILLLSAAGTVHSAVSTCILMSFPCNARIVLNFNGLLCIFTYYSITIYDVSERIETLKHYDVSLKLSKSSRYTSYILYNPMIAILDC